jgi:hypothetical protein
MRSLVAVNPGLASRFPTTVTFHDYSATQLMAIADKMLTEEQMVLAAAARAKLETIFGKVASVRAAAARARAQRAHAISCSQCDLAASAHATLLPYLPFAAGPPAVPRQSGDKASGNARAVRNLLEQAKRQQAMRLVSIPGKKTAEVLMLITDDDVPAK